MSEKCSTSDAEIQPEYIPCPNIVGAFAGYSDGHFITGCLPCNSWSCPVCGPRKKKALWYRYTNGAISNELNSVYGRKFLTLTCPGKEYRSANPDPEMVYVEMASHFSHMIRNLRHKYGHFDFMRVAEPQRDGYPHFHVLLVGDAIAPKSILNDIDHFWKSLYGMGYLKLNKVAFKDGNHAVNYIMKYMTKGMRGFGRWKRIFSVSNGALARVRKVEWVSMKVVMGRAKDTGVHVMPVSSMGHILDESLKMASGFASDGLHRTFEGAKEQVLNILVGSHALPSEHALMNVE